MTRHRLLSLAWLPALLLGAACASTEPEMALPEGAEPFTPSAEFTEWWGKTEACSGLSGHLESVKWYVVPGAHSFDTELGEHAGLRIGTGENVRIVLAGDYSRHELVVRHEMLHALLNRSGHPEEYFVTKCGLTWESWNTQQPRLAAN